MQRSTTFSHYLAHKYITKHQTYMYGKLYIFGIPLIRQTRCHTFQLDWSKLIFQATVQYLFLFSILIMWYHFDSLYFLFSFSFPANFRFSSLACIISLSKWCLKWDEVKLPINWIVTLEQNFVSSLSLVCITGTMPQRVRFSVVYATSTESGHNMKELESHNPQVRRGVDRSVGRSVGQSVISKDETLVALTNWLVKRPTHAATDRLIVDWLTSLTRWLIKKSHNIETVFNIILIHHHHMRTSEMHWISVVYSIISSDVVFTLMVHIQFQIVYFMSITDYAYLCPCT